MEKRSRERGKRNEKVCKREGGNTIIEKPSGERGKCN